MGIFRYKAVGVDGRRLDGEMEAPDAASVIGRLRSAGHWPLSAEPAGGGVRLGGLMSRLRQWRERTRATEVTAVTRELATLLGAGIPLDGSLRMLERHAHRPELKAALHAVHDAVQGGRRLSAALGEHERIFDPLYVNLIKAGEASGSLASAFDHLANHREKADAFRANLVSALTYPAALATVAILSLLVLFAFVIPRFIPLFADAEAPLPLLTEVVFGVAELLQGWWWSLAALGLGGTIWAKRWLSDPVNRLELDRRALRAPLVGDLLGAAETVRLASTLETLLRNGLPLLAALKLTQGVLRNRRIQAAIDNVIGVVRGGGRLAPALAAENVLPSLAVELMTIGEESGQLEAMLGKASEAFATRVDQKLKRLLTLLEPALILGLGAVIALVIVGILMAMLSLNELIV